MHVVWQDPLQVLLVDSFRIWRFIKEDNAAGVVLAARFALERLAVSARHAGAGCHSMTGERNERL